MKHKLKIRYDYLYHILEGKKRFEIRYNDRDFQVGDTIVFLPEEKSSLKTKPLYASDIPDYRIDYVFCDDGYLQEGYVCLSISSKDKAELVEKIEKYLIGILFTGANLSIENSCLRNLKEEEYYKINKAEWKMRSQTLFDMIKHDNAICDSDD